MKITVQFFAGLAEAAGTKSFTSTLSADATLAELQAILLKELPQAATLITRSFFSVNHDFADLTTHITEHDQIALIPPVSGGEATDTFFEITTSALSADALIKKVSHRNAGAILTFVGTVREMTQGKRTMHLEYEAYPEMAIKKMQQIDSEIQEKWPGTVVAMSHRVGQLDIEEIAVVIAVATPHRAASFEAGRYAIERLKQIVPIWKKEKWDDGEEWIGHQQGPWNPLADSESDQ